MLFIFLDMDMKCILFLFLPCRVYNIKRMPLFQTEGDRDFNLIIVPFISEFQV